MPGLTERKIVRDGLSPQIVGRLLISAARETLMNEGNIALREADDEVIKIAMNIATVICNFDQ